MKFIKLGILILAASQMCACATIIRGTTEPFEVMTIPPGATVTTNLETPASKELRKENEALQPTYYSCQTPCTWELSRKAEFDLKIDMDGYHPVNLKIESKYGFGSSTTATNLAASTGGAAAVVVTAYATAAGGAAWLPAVAGATGYAGFVGVGFDVATGAMKDLSPNPIALQLYPSDKPLPVPPSDERPDGAPEPEDGDETSEPDPV